VTGLPTSVEAYLVEGGFNPTEILVLRRLLEGSAMTLRELASKTGKSTGVLDQATRKLITKGIVSREVINDTTKYTVGSLEAIQTWMREDMQKKHKELHRKEQDFESFISALKVDQARPEMEYFEGQEGITKAYGKLLTLAEKELLFYVPVSCKEEDDPLRDFRVQHFRARHKRELFSRVLAPETHLGKRYQSRDHFEYRKTVLVPETQFPVSFEKVIAGDTIACFNHPQQSACFLRYPELAQSERAMFEMMWERGEEEKEDDKEEEEEKIALSTVTMSAVRDFLISRKSIAAFVACAVLAAAVTFGLYRQNVYLNTQRVRERAMSIAATAALQFDAEELVELRTEDDAARPEYERVIIKMREIREQNEGVVYMYIMRPTEQENVFAFVADADSLDLDAKIDLNHDGVIDDADWLSPPGELYDDTLHPTMHLALDGPMADEESVTDQWGTWLSGHAPIRDDKGNAVAIIGIDMNASDVQELSQETFRLFLYFLGFFILFVFVRLAAFNRSLCEELLKLIDTKEVMILLGSSALLALLITFGIYKYSYNLNLQRVRERVMAIAATAAPEFDVEDLASIRVKEDMEKEAYQKTFRKLNEMRDQNEDVMYVYILRPTEDKSTFEFVVDADSNFDLPFFQDQNEDGIMDEADEAVWPGDQYDVSEIPALQDEALQYPAADAAPVSDQWGTFITGFAPVMDGSENVVAVIGVDIDASEVMRLTRESFRFVLFFFGLFILFVLVGLAVYSKNLRSDLLILINAKAVLITLGVCSLIALGITYGMYRYTLNIMKDEIGQRLMSIAATAAPEIDAKDLEVLHIAKDMEREEYQRVFKKLNEIRERNEDVVFAYIMRPTEQTLVWEFVVDADTSIDAISSNDEELEPWTYPGLNYYLLPFSPELAAYGLERPTYEKNIIIDQWGVFLSATAPIYNSDKEAVAIIAFDMDISGFYSLVRDRFVPIIWFISLFAVISILSLVVQLRGVIIARFNTQAR